jgi:hypothetical protein
LNRRPRDYEWGTGREDMPVGPGLSVRRRPFQGREGPAEVWPGGEWHKIGTTPDAPESDHSPPSSLASSTTRAATTTSTGSPANVAPTRSRTPPVAAEDAPARDGERGPASGCGLLCAGVTPNDLPAEVSEPSPSRLCRRRAPRHSGATQGIPEWPGCTEPLRTPLSEAPWHRPRCG